MKSVTYFFFFTVNDRNRREWNESLLSTELETSVHLRHDERSVAEKFEDNTLSYDF